MDALDLTIIVTAHDEGITAHKTMLSLFRALEPIEEAGVTYEILVHVDQGDVDTTKYFSRYAADNRVRVVESDFGDLGLSRNRALALSCGEFVALLDGDDLVSKNWLIEALQLVKAADFDLIARPQMVVKFTPGLSEDWPVLIQQNNDSGTRDYEAIRMLSNNPWPAVMLARRTLLAEPGFVQNSRGFGFEDYAFNADMVAKGVRQVVVPRTVFYYRQKDDGVYARLRRSNAVFFYSELFDTGYLQSITIPPEVAGVMPAGMRRRSLLRAFVVSGYELAASLPLIGRAARGLLGMWRKGRRRRADVSAVIPDWMIEEWKGINQIEFKLFPRQDLLAGLEIYPTTDSRLGWIYRRLIDGVSAQVDYLFVVPWLVQGGADKVMLHYVKALLEVYPGLRIAVLTTQMSENAWHSQLPRDVAFIDFGNLAFGLSDDDKEVLLNRLMVQLRVPSLHIINSLTGYLWVRSHPVYIKENGIKVFASIFAKGSLGSGQLTSYSDPYLKDIYPLLSKVTTDNQQVVDEVMAESGLLDMRFAVHHMPSQDSLVEVKLIDPSRLVRVIWASRLAKSKRLDILVRIAEALDGDRFHIDFYGSLDLDDYPANVLKGVSNLSYLGAYDGIDSLPTGDYDIFLYTTESDGLPNILLEMAAKGLPIVASNRGGVGEFVIDGQTGLLVDDYENASAYVAALERLTADPLAARTLAQAAQRLLQQRHSVEAFKAQVRRDIVL